MRDRRRHTGAIACVGYGTPSGAGNDTDPRAVLGKQTLVSIIQPDGKSMNIEKIESKAFQRAVLKSESFRILALLCILGALVPYAVVNGLAAGKVRLLLAQTLVLTLAIAYESFRLMVVKRALLEERKVPAVMWMPDVFIETQLPTIALFLLMKVPTSYPYEALVTPAVLLYFFFIILSTLRLSPLLSCLTGLISALGYLAATFYVREQHAVGDTSPFFFPLVYFIYAGLILAGGIVSAVVAGQIRTHVVAALQEAAVQRELDRVNHDLDIARTIQQGLLPHHSPQLTDFEVAGMNQPADQTGGDYFDWLELPDGRLAISLGDASGHGIGPALVTTSCRAYARASFLDGGKQEGLLDSLNCLLAEDLAANRFVTFAVAFLDPAQSRLQVLSAGHGPIMLYRYETDRIEYLDVQGIPLGMLAGVKYEQATNAFLRPGDMLILVTDGFYEWEDPEGEQFGLDRLRAVIRNSRDCSAEEVISRLCSAVMNFCKGTRQQDDLTAVILRRKVKPLVAKKSAVKARANGRVVPVLQAASAPPPAA
jgi:serine phosphatase RsbU (regulator of sigma subunit)